jgi:translocation protein SEC63
MEISQHILQALPVGSYPLQQLPGIDKKLAQSLGMENHAVKTIQDLLALREDERRKTLEILDEQQYQLAMCVAKQIPVLVISNTHFKGTPSHSTVHPELAANWLK